jgi:hypothetical protein
MVQTHIQWRSEVFLAPEAGTHNGLPDINYEL